MTEAYEQSMYCLPASYNMNRVVLLARDPHCLYAYWDIEDNFRYAFTGMFGQKLWDNSLPALKINNVSLNHSFCIDIDSYSSSCYINVENANSLYMAELGRKMPEQFFINIAASNYVYTACNKPSSNTASYFADYNGLRRCGIDMTRPLSVADIGISSPELIHAGFLQNHFGMSSGEFLALRPEEQLRSGSAFMPEAFYNDHSHRS